MKFKILQGIIAMSKLGIRAFFVLLICTTTMLASSGNAQKAKSVRDVFIDVNFKEATVLEALRQPQ